MQAQLAALKVPQSLGGFAGFAIPFFFVNRCPTRYSLTFAHGVGCIFSKGLAACVFDIGGAIIIATDR
jgi:hypothetical protein